MLNGTSLSRSESYNLIFSFKKCIEKVYDEWKKSSEFNFVKEPNAGKGSKFTFEGMHRIAPITEIVSFLVD